MRQWTRAIQDFTTHMQANGKRPATIEQRRYQISRLAEDQLRRSPWRLSTSEIERWLAGHLWSPATNRSYVYAIRAFYRWASDSGRVRMNPAANLKAAALRGLPHPTPAAVVEQAIQGATDRNALVIMLGYEAGLRRGEIASLRWADISADQIRVENGKGGDRRIVPIGGRLAEALQAERDRRGEGSTGTGYRYISPESAYLFGGQSGGHIHPKSLSRRVRRLLGGEWTLHSLRHAYATDLLEAGEDLSRVQELLGHRTPATTRIYTEVSMRARRNAVTALQRYRNGGKR